MDCQIISITVVSIFVCLLTVGCASVERIYEAYKYANQFRKDTTGYEKPIPEIFVVPPKNIFLRKTHQGECLHLGVKKYIFIRKSFWEESSEPIKWAIIYHEMGHCYLDLGHAEIENDCPRSIMAPALGKEECYDTAEERELYIQELNQRKDYGTSNNR